ncbi:MAG: YbjN domain-containing protein [Fimbriimonadaceae bacterium]
MTMVSTLTDLDIRDLLTQSKIPGEKITIREEKDSEGLTAFYVFEGESILLALYQYTDAPGEKVTSLGMSVGNRMAQAADLRKINSWNAKSRYVKAYVDDEGDAMLSTDMLLSPGVTRLTVQEWVKMFAKFSREFTVYLKN